MFVGGIPPLLKLAALGLKRKSSFYGAAAIAPQLHCFVACRPMSLGLSFFLARLSGHKVTKKELGSILCLFILA